jgi:hypothetical protein
LSPFFEDFLAGPGDSAEKPSKFRLDTIRRRAHEPKSGRKKIK